MQIFIKLKESCKFNTVKSRIGTFKKGVIHSIHERYFDASIMEKVDLKKAKAKIKKPEPTKKEEDKIIEKTIDFREPLGVSKVEAPKQNLAKK